MPDAVIIKSFDCGCGWRSELEHEAVHHANTMKHNITIHGRIVAEKEFHVPVPTTEYRGRRGRSHNGQDDAA